MKNENFLYLIALLTVLFFRITLFLLPLNTDVLISGIAIHHFWVGLLLLIMVKEFARESDYMTLFLSGAGIGMFIDELIFMFLGGGQDLEYWASASTWGMILMMSLFFLYRKEAMYRLVRPHRCKCPK